MLKWRWVLLALWLVAFIVSGYLLEHRREAYQLAQSVKNSRPGAGKCDWIALRTMPAAYRLAEQDVAGPSGSAVKLAGKYSWRALAKGERICEQDVSPTPHVALPQGYSGVVISVTPGPWNAGVIVDLWLSGVPVVENARMAAVLCEQSCNQVIVEVPAEKVATLLGCLQKGTPSVVVRTLP